MATNTCLAATMAIIPGIAPKVMNQTVMSTVTMLIREDSLATVACQLDLQEHLIAQDGTTAFLGEPDTELPRHTA